MLLQFKSVNGNQVYINPVNVINVEEVSGKPTETIVYFNFSSGAQSTPHRVFLAENVKSVVDEFNRHEEIRKNERNDILSYIEEKVDNLLSVLSGR